MWAIYIILGMIILSILPSTIKKNNQHENNKTTWRKPYRKSIFSTLKKVRRNNDNNFINEQFNLKKWPYIKRKLMTKTECQLYKLIQEAVPHLCIFAQVQLSQVIFFPSVKKINEKNYWTNRINRMSLDYVITNNNFETIVVIELDDPSHNLPERKKSDLKKDKALKDAGITIIRIPINQIPSKELLRQQITNLELLLERNRHLTG